MRRIPLIVVAVLLVAGLAACSHTAPTTGRYADVRHRAPPRPKLKRNPNPTAYELTVTLKDAPGPFATAKGFMQYETKLQDPCTPDLGGMSGSRMRLGENVPFELTKVDDTTYRGVIYPDLFEDHDYFGLGSCHIEFIAARAEFRPEVGQSDFVEYVMKSDVVAESTVNSGFLRRQYPNGTIAGASVPSFRKGTQMRERVNEEDLFEIELKARKLAH